MSQTHDVLSRLAVAIHCPEGENLVAKIGPFKTSVQATERTYFMPNLMMVVCKIRLSRRSTNSEYCVVGSYRNQRTIGTPVNGCQVGL